MKIFFYLKHFSLYDSPCSEGVSKAVHGLASGLAAVGQSVTILSEGPAAGCRQSELAMMFAPFPLPIRTQPCV